MYDDVFATQELELTLEYRRSLRRLGKDFLTGLISPSNWLRKNTINPTS